jgi:DNA-binding NarL/FixJ family response regulator
LVAAASASRRDQLESIVRARARFKLMDAIVGSSALAMRARSLHPEVVLIDSPTAESSLPAITSDLEQAGAAVVVLVDEPDASWTGPLLHSGVRALLPRDASPADIHSALEAAHRGLLLLDAELGRELLALKANVRSQESDAGLMEELTRREIEVLRMMAEGLGNKEIAARLAISDHTVKFHISSILAKLGASTRTEAVTTGIRMGLVPL